MDQNSEEQEEADEIHFMLKMIEEVKNEVKRRTK